MRFRTFLFAFALGTGAVVPAVAFAQQCKARWSVPYDVAQVKEDGLVAAFMTPKTKGPHPALVVLSGSEGGSGSVQTLARMFVTQGYAVLALSYFGAPGLPPSAEDIPLEYFDRGVAWLARQPQVDPKRMGIFGVSKGGEASLLVASRSPQLRAAAAGVPSHVVWQGIDMTGSGRITSTWSLGGKPVPYLPYDASVTFDTSRPMESIHALYAGALSTAASRPEARIPVEKINGPVMLISGRADAMWPSARMSDEVVARLKGSGFRHRVQHLSYPNAGHSAATPPAVPPQPQYPDEGVGGTVDGNIAARMDMWPKLICFFDKALAKGR